MKLTFTWTCKHSYQMNPANYREALIETREDEAEGADILLVSMTMALMPDFYSKVCW